MALFTNNAEEDDRVQLYTKTSEELSDTHVIFSHQLQLKKHTRLHFLSFVFHVIWLLVVIVLLVLLLKSSHSTVPTSQTSHQVSNTSNAGHFDVQSTFAEKLLELNSTINQVREQQRLLNSFLQNITKQSKIQHQNFNTLLQDVRQDLQTHKLTANTTFRRFGESQRTLNSTCQDLTVKLENHEQVANSYMVDLSFQQQNLTDILKNEFITQIETIKQGMEESINKTMQRIAELGDITKPTTPPISTLPVYLQAATLDHYLYQDNLPAMTAMTACFWLNIASGSSWKSGYIISIAVQVQSNELMVGIDNTGFPEFWINNNFLKLTTNTTSMDSLWIGWNKHCFTWKSAYKVKWYTDTITNGQLQLMGSVNVSRDTVRSGGHMTLLQEQDSFGGNFDLSQTVPGKLAGFNMWDYEMTADQINTLNCGGEGNVASWDTLKQHGTGQVTYEVFPQCKDRVLPVYNQAHTTSHYRYQRSLPAMSQMTTCFWFSGLASDDKNGDFLISIAIPQQQNELIIGWQYSGKMSMYIHDAIKTFPLSAQYDDMNTLWVGWHKHCFTFKAGGQAMWYTDLATSGYVELVSTVDVSADTIRSGGFMTLLQEQDSFGGGFDVTQTVPGKMAEFNMWNRQMTADELNTATCGGTGNVASWDTLLYQGSSNITYEHFPLCDS